MIDNITDGSIFPTSIIAKSLTIQNKRFTLEPIYFSRTGNNAIGVLFEFTIKALGGVEGKGSDDVDKETYETVKSLCELDSINDDSFLKEYKNDITGMFDFDSKIYHSLHDMRTIDIAMPSMPHGHYTIVIIKSYVSFELTFDNSTQINKMVLSLPDKYLGRYSLGNEKRTNILLQDKEA